MGRRVGRKRMFCSGQHNLYSEEYKSKIVRLIMLNHDAEEWIKNNLLTNTLSFEEKQMRKLAYFAGVETTRIELEKENAELKEQNIKDCENFNKTMSETKERWNKEHYQLTKATEIIKDLLLMAKVENLERNYESVDEAKQFLEEVKE